MCRADPSGPDPAPEELPPCLHAPDATASPCPSRCPSLLAACSAPAAASVVGASHHASAAAPAPPPSAEPSPSPAAAFPVTLTDDEGTTVEIAAEPQVIVSLTPATTEILFELGAGDRVVATDDGSDYPGGRRRRSPTSRRSPASTSRRS